MTREEAIALKLKENLAPAHLEVMDQSESHRGHAGYRPGGGTHFRVVIVAACFEGMNRVTRHRLVYENLSDLFAEGMHALALQAYTPEEFEARPIR